MRKRRDFTEEQILEIIKAEKNVSKKYEAKRILILRLLAVDKMKVNDIEKIVNYSKATINNIVWKYFKHGLNSMLGENRRGGNHRYLSEKETEELLKPFEKQAESGHILIVSNIKKAYEERVGKEVPNSTIYRVIARQKWRKVMPRSKHPKSKPEEQETYKKNSS